jgi:hypothetical protein
VAGVPEQYDRTSALSVARGLHVLRYVSVQGGGNPPVAFVKASMETEGALEIVCAPWLAQGQLVRPGDCVVLRAERPVELTVGLRRGAPGGGLDASFRLEPLVPSEESVAARSDPRLALTLAKAGVVEPLSLLAHVSMRGDVVVKESEWAAGPEAPAPIEGLEIRGAVGDGVSLEAQVLVSSRPPRWSSWAPAGEYAGTRGRYLQLVGVRLRLTGAKADRREIVADALFLGSLVMSKRGQEIEFVSKSGVDPLVGLKLGVVETVAPVVDRPAFIAGRERDSRVRVFRASANA